MTIAEFFVQEFEEMVFLLCGWHFCIVTQGSEKLKGFLVS
jgi:hypothetical protein